MIKAHKVSYFVGLREQLNVRLQTKWLRFGIQLQSLKLPIALAQVKAGNTFENLLKEIR